LKIFGHAAHLSQLSVALHDTGIVHNEVFVDEGEDLL
jgi:hypothetical protein